jgi:hypothetical protein
VHHQCPHLNPAARLLLCVEQEYHARFESCTKTYSFHFRETPDTSQPNLPAALIKTASTASSSSRREVSHYGSRPYDALFEGYFVQAAAAKAYMALYQASHKAPPYSTDIYATNCDKLADRVSWGMQQWRFNVRLLLVALHANAYSWVHRVPAGCHSRCPVQNAGHLPGNASYAHLSPANKHNVTHGSKQCSQCVRHFVPPLVQIEADAVNGSTLEAFRRLLLLVLLQDNALLKDGPLQASMLVAMEELLLSRPIASQQDMLLSTVVNLARMLNSGAAEIQGGPAVHALLHCQVFSARGTHGTQWLFGPMQVPAVCPPDWALCLCFSNSHM